MPYIRIPEITGLVYVPEYDKMILKKHDCSDCARCQMCNDDKCANCLGQRAECRKEDTVNTNIGSYLKEVQNSSCQGSGGVPQL